MKRTVLLIIFAVTRMTYSAFSQTQIAFISDTQAPMWIEDVFLKSNNNKKATALLFDEITKQKPDHLFILGDVVSLGHKEKKWREMDSYLLRCRQEGIEVSALLGNHDVMLRAKKGEQLFQKRFPTHMRTGFVKITDSVAVVLLNSNFKKNSKQAIEMQLAWLKKTLQDLDTNPAIQAVVVSCHHAPYSNSKIVGTSEHVQNLFVPPFLQSAKSKLFMTGHSHAFEHFKIKDKNFLVIGGGGGIHQPLESARPTFTDLATTYKPMFHYVTISRTFKILNLTSYFLKADFSGFEKGYSIPVH
jgi:UDP-2,3-diacylglucosamine pyrophosphatase LpxH